MPPAFWPSARSTECCARGTECTSCSLNPKLAVRRLATEITASSGSGALGECSRQLSDQTGKRHVEGGIQIAGFWTRVVLEHFHGDGSVVGDDHARFATRAVSYAAEVARVSKPRNRK